GPSPGTGASPVIRRPACSRRPSAPDTSPWQPTAMCWRPARSSTVSRSRNCRQKSSLSTTHPMSSSLRCVHKRLCLRNPEIRATRRMDAEVGAVLLLYHRVHDADLDPWRLCVSPHLFAEHLGVLREQFSPIALHDLVEEHGRRTIPP